VFCLLFFVYLFIGFIGLYIYLIDMPTDFENFPADNVDRDPQGFLIIFLLLFVYTS
jgi:hypothetical protein